MNGNLEPFVSICCITYNHERFIRDAIEGFLKQETDFPFEIIIQDDASTDQTADIIRENERKYPDIIKPIYHKENQYSKGINPIILPLQMAEGKYIALCEGDDYWTDPLKLQKQINEMGKHPECYLSFHPAIVKWDDGSKRDKILCNHSKKLKIFSTEEVILGGGGFMPSASLIIDASVIPRIISFFDIAKNAPVGDVFIQILGAENGGALFLSDVMCVYRKSSGSWSEKALTNKKYIEFWLSSSLECNDKMDTFTNYHYSKFFNIKRKKIISEILRSSGVGLIMKEDILMSNRSKMNLKDLIILNIIFNYSIIVTILGKAKVYKKK